MTDSILLKAREICAGVYNLSEAFRMGIHNGELDDYKSMQCTLTALRQAEAEKAELVTALEGIFNHLDSFHGDAPGHWHKVQGIWDNDNGAKSGTECERCKAWRDAKAALAKHKGPAA